MTFDEMLKQALSETVDERVEKMLNVEPKPRFSLSYRLWERRTLKCLSRNQYDSRWTLHKARRIMTTLTITAAIILSLTACAVVNLMIGRFSFDDKSDYSKLFIEKLSSDKSRIEEYYGLPEEEGWVITDYGDLEDRILISYKRGEKIVSFEQTIIKDGNIGNINTENAVVEPMSIYEENDGFFIKFQHGDCGLWWIYDGYLFSVSGNLNKDELLNLAHSTKIVKY